MIIVTLACSYIIRNCLPCDIEIILLKSREKFIIAKSEKLFIDSYSLDDSLSIKIRFMNFSNIEDVLLYKAKKEVILICLSLGK